MTVNDIYKCSNMMDNTKFVIHSDDGVTVYDGTWYNMSEKLKGVEVLFSLSTRWTKWISSFMPKRCLWR